MISETLNVLANHSRSKESYFIYLAMEKHEKDSDKKAKQLISEFKERFRHMDFTSHEVQPLEYKGKGSNVSWCAELLEDKFKEMNLST